MRRMLIALVGALLGVVLLAPQAAAVPAQKPFCGITWGSLDIEAGRSMGGSLVNLRSGRHACYDRLVVDVRGTIGHYSAGYVPVVRADGSGEPVKVDGGAALQVFVFAPNWDRNDTITYAPTDDRRAVDVRGYRTFRQVSYLGAFEGDSHIAIGVRARLPYRVFVLDGPGDLSRLVIDVAHRW